MRKNINLSSKLSKELLDEKINFDENSPVLKALEQAKKEINAIHNVLSNPEVEKTALITALRVAVKNEISNCINEKEIKNLEKIYDKLLELDKGSLRKLKKDDDWVVDVEEAVNNTDYRPEKAA